MISFIICLALLIGGYFVYGKVVENTFAPDDRETPAVRINDGVDYVVMPQWKLFLVQLLNIAGLGPIFGAMQGALWGPVVFLWITFGTIFAGGVHDYFSGMLSERNDGASISEVCGIYLGNVMKNVMRVFSVVLLVMVGTVFAVGPAGLIVTLLGNKGVTGVLANPEVWLWIILAYYFVATFISIDKIIGRIYPLFGICLIVMAVGVIVGIFTNPNYTIPEIWTHFTNMHPAGKPIWSFMFITVACGAISGFHSTQSPLMARCMKSEKRQMNPVADIFDRRMLHMLAYLRIQPNPRADDKTPMSEHIIAICNHTIIDLPDPPRLKNPAQSAHRSSRKPEPARQITACPHRNIAQRHHVAGNDSVHDLIHRPVTAHDHNHPCLLAVGRQLPCILCRPPRIFCQICLILNPVPHKPLLYFLPYLIAAATL